MAGTVSTQSIIDEIKADPQSKGFVHYEADELDDVPIEVGNEILAAFTDGTILLGVTSTQDDLTVAWKPGPAQDAVEPGDEPLDAA